MRSTSLQNTLTIRPTNQLRRTRNRRQRYLLGGLMLALGLSVASPAIAQINITNTADLNAAIQTIDNNPNTNYTLNFLNSFTLNQPLSNLNTTGTITLQGNSFSVDGQNAFPPFNIQNGTVVLNNLNFTNAGGPVTIDNGLLIDHTASLQGAVTNNAAIKFDFANAGTYAGNMTGTGSVEISGPGAVNFSGGNSYTGGTTIDVNSTLVGTTTSLRGNIVDNWLLKINQSTAGTFTGNVSGTGGLEIDGTGPITLAGNYSYTAGTLVSQGATLIGTTDNLLGTIYNNGKVQFNQSSTGTYAGNISGLGTVEISGMGQITFSGTNTYGGGTIIDANTTLVGTTTSLQGQFNNLGQLKFDQNSSGTFAGSISGSGAVEISGTGPVTFSGTNSYTGGTQIDLGSTLIGTTNSITGTINNLGQVQFNQPSGGEYHGNIFGSGSVEISGNSSVRFSGTNSYSGGTTIDNGSFLSGTTTALQGNILNQGGLQFDQTTSGTFTGSISGAGRVEIGGTGHITFAQTNTYSGGTTIDAGSTLISSIVALPGNVINNGTLNFQNWLSGPIITPLDQAIPNIVIPGYPVSGSNPNPFGYVGTFKGDISGTGSLEVSGLAAMALSGHNTYTGGTTVDAGNVLIGSTDSLQGNVVNNGTVKFAEISAHQNWVGDPPLLLLFDQGWMTSAVQTSFTGFTSIPGTYAGNMSGTGQVEITNGSFLFTGTNTYTGGTIVDGNAVLLGTTSSLQGSFLNNGSVQFDQSNAGTYAGNMSGTGRVGITGTGPVTFSGTNSYTGGTAIAAGSTLIGTTSSLQGGFLDYGLLKFNQSTAGTFAGDISGSGMVQISGSGSVTFTGTNNALNGTIIDNGGTLIVASSGVMLGDVNVNNTGTLQGSGTVGGTFVNAGGTIHPGNPGGTLEVKDLFQQGTGSTYTVDLTPTASDKIFVDGLATIAHGTTLNLNVGQGKYTVGTSYQILSANGDTSRLVHPDSMVVGQQIQPIVPLTGKYDTVLTSPISQNIEFIQQNSDHDIKLVVTSNLSGGTLTSNQASLAAMIDRTSGTATGNYATQVTQLTTLNPGQLSNALNQLSGEIFPNLTTVQRQTTTAQMQLISNRLAQMSGRGEPELTASRDRSTFRLVSMQSSDGTLPAAGVDSRPQKFGWDGWVQGYGLGGNVTGDNNAGGSNYRLGGTLFGVENWLLSSFLFGVLGGYASTTVTDKLDSAHANINSYQGGIYELYKNQWLYVSNIDAYTNNDYSSNRSINFGTPLTASGSSTGNQWSHYTELGKTFNFDELQLQPFAGVQYIYLNQKGFTESGAGTLDMTTSDQTINSVRSSFGARVNAQSVVGDTLIVPTIAARYQHEWGNGTNLITSSFSGAPTAAFSTNGNRTGRDFGLFTLGATAFLNEQVSIFGSVDAQVASGFFGVIGSGGIQYLW